MHVVYFIYSLIFIIFRTFGLAFLAARINDESKKPLKLLLSVPSHAWTTETKRFYNEVYCNTIALSGMEFFFLTRKLILSVIGTICTYELVLMQLNREWDYCTTSCQILLVATLQYNQNKHLHRSMYQCGLFLSVKFKFFLSIQSKLKEFYEIWIPKQKSVTAYRWTTCNFSILFFPFGEWIWQTLLCIANL